MAITDGNGNVTDRIEYSAYGTATFRAGTNDTPFLFNGRYGVMTDGNGLLYMRARYYNPYLCRFINADPSGFAGGLNFYVYASGNPVSLIDPFGLAPFNPGLAFYFQGPGSQQRIDDLNQNITTINYALSGVAVGVASGGTVSLGALALVSAGVSQSVVTGGLLVTGAAGIVSSGYSMYYNRSPDNIAFNAGALAGGFLAGGMTGETVNSALSPTDYQPSGPASLSSDVSMAWRDSNGNINPFAFLSDWLFPGANVGPMSTGPSTIGASVTIGGAGAAVGAGFSPSTGQGSLDWLGNSGSSSPTGKVH